VQLHRRPGPDHQRHFGRRHRPDTQHRVSPNTDSCHFILSLLRYPHPFTIRPNRRWPWTPSQPPITRTTHTLPFDKLSPRDFERLCLWLVEREGYQRAEHLGAVAMQIQRFLVGSGGFGNSSPPLTAAVHLMKRYGVNLGGFPPLFPKGPQHTRNLRAKPLFICVLLLAIPSDM